MRTPCGHSEWGSSSKALGGNGSKVIKRSVLIWKARLDKVSTRLSSLTHSTIIKEKPVFARAGSNVVIKVGNNLRCFKHQIMLKLILGVLSYLVTSSGADKPFGASGKRSVSRRALFRAPVRGCIAAIQNRRVLVLHVASINKFRINSIMSAERWLWRTKNA